MLDISCVAVVFYILFIFEFLFSLACYGNMDYGFWPMVCGVTSLLDFFTLPYYIIAFRFSADGNVALAHELPVLIY